jgi:Family of unknown function (DUF5681)
MEATIVNNSKDENRVGYKTPPVGTRFKPGQSGNSSGRPKKPKSLSAELVEELEEFTSVKEGGRDVQVTKARAVAKAVVRAAAGGDMRATAVLMSLFARGAQDEPTEEVTPEETALVDNFVDREVRRRDVVRRKSTDPKQKDSHNE